MATHMVPVNLSAADAHAAAGLGSDVALPDPPTADQLDNWAQEAYSLDVSAAASFGFPVDNLSASQRQQALMFGVSRWRDVTAGGDTYRFGVALRVLIVVSDIKGGDSLTLPVVAARVEIEGARATAHMLVRGYHGSQLAGALPSWQSFGVDSYAEYMKAVSNIQGMILEDESGIEPELLATTVFAPSLPSPPPLRGRSMPSTRSRMGRPSGVRPSISRIMTVRWWRLSARSIGRGSARTSGQFPLMSSARRRRSSFTGSMSATGSRGDTNAVCASVLGSGCSERHL
jgi:hypothetical protein